MATRHRLPRVIKLGKNVKYIIQNPFEFQWVAVGYVNGKQMCPAYFPTEESAVAWAKKKKM